MGTRQGRNRYNVMELSRPIRDPPLITHDGVDFCLDGRELKIHCSITRAALIFLAGHSLLVDDYQRVFETYRDEIEDAARRKDKNRPNGRHRLTVNAQDLVALDSGLSIQNEGSASEP